MTPWPTWVGNSARERGYASDPRWVGIGNRWRGGSGVVVAENRVLTNAHNLHGDEVTVTFADGRTAERRSLGVDADGDLAILEVATESAPPLEPGRRCARRSARRGGARQPERPRPAGDVRLRERHRPLLPRSTWPSRGRRRRAHRAADAGLVGRPDRRPRRAPARDQHEPARRRLLPGHRGRCGAARPGRALGPASRRRARDWASGWRRPTSPVASAARSACPSAMASSSAKSRTTRRPRRPGSPRATSSCRPAARRSPRPTTCSTPWAGEGALEIGLVRGADELTVTVAA